MPALTIIPDIERSGGFNAVRSLLEREGLEVDPTLGDRLRDEGKIVHLSEGLEVGGLSAGMESGNPSVAFCFPLPDGRVVIAETSLKLLIAAARGLTAALGEPR